MSKDGEIPAGPEFLFVTTNAVCIDPSLGELMEGYVCDELTPEQQEQFELHMLDCLACDTDVCNFRSMCAAAHYINKQKAELRTKVRKSGLAIEVRNEVRAIDKATRTKSDAKLDIVKPE